MTLQGNVDLQKLVGWPGASFSTRWYWLSGQDLSAEHVGNIFPVSSISGYNTFRLNELWLQQNFLGDRISIRVGQLGADSEFYLSTHAIVFLNATFSWSPYLYNQHPKWRPSVSDGYTGDPVSAYASKLAELPRGYLSGQSVCPKRQSLWIPMGSKLRPTAISPSTN